MDTRNARQLTSEQLVEIVRGATPHTPASEIEMMATHAGVATLSPEHLVTLAKAGFRLTKINHRTPDEAYWSQIKVEGFPVSVYTPDPIAGLEQYRDRESSTSQ